ncbi:MAG: helix-turn-helix transcriptional regulator [Coriobacteriia bacterium]|nr:helix-turn-helix transcriptional regulator [Coriobacteriia bacterium]
MKKSLMQNQLIDWNIFGRQIKKARKSAGFSNVAYFAEYLKDETGVELSSRTLYKIECGKTCPTSEALIALLIALPRERHGDILANSFIGAAKDQEFAIVSLRPRNQESK